MLFQKEENSGKLLGFFSCDTTGFKKTKTMKLETVRLYNMCISHSFGTNPEIIHFLNQFKPQKLRRECG